jgi:hypothetical protein
VVATPALLLSLATLEDPVVEVRHKHLVARRELETWAIIPPSKDSLAEPRDQMVLMKTDKVVVVAAVQQAPAAQQLM